MSKIPTIEINMDKKCDECGRDGACQNGLCLKCGFKKLNEKIKDKVKSIVREDQGNLFEESE